MEDEIEIKEDRKKTQDGLAEGWAKRRTGFKKMATGKAEVGQQIGQVRG